MNTIEGCQISGINHLGSKAWLAHLLLNSPGAAAIHSPAWFLCHCDDGVTWGYIENGEWRLGSEVFPDICPIPSEKNIQEFRIFSQEYEVLVWRNENELRGRILQDEPQSLVVGPTKPQDEPRLLLGGCVVDTRKGFTRLGDGTGAEQVLPPVLVHGECTCPTILGVRHYFSRDENSGCVRVAATRLLEVK